MCVVMCDRNRQSKTRNSSRKITNYEVNGQTWWIQICRLTWYSFTENHFLKSLCDTLINKSISLTFWLNQFGVVHIICQHCRKVWHTPFCKVKLFDARPFTRNTPFYNIENVNGRHYPRRLLESRNFWHTAFYKGENLDIRLFTRSKILTYAVLRDSHSNVFLRWCQKSVYLATYSSNWQNPRLQFKLEWNRKTSSLPVTWIHHKSLV